MQIAFSPRRALACMDARLQGCSVVEPRLEQAAEVVERGQEQAAEVVPIPLLWRGARQGGVVEPRLEPAAEMNPERIQAELPQVTYRSNFMRAFPARRCHRSDSTRLLARRAQTR